MRTGPFFRKQDNPCFPVSTKAVSHPSVSSSHYASNAMNRVAAGPIFSNMSGCVIFGKLYATLLC